MKVSKYRTFRTRNIRNPSAVPNIAAYCQGQIPDQCSNMTKKSSSMCALVFTLRAHSGCASNLLMLFERVDKAAVKLFIVRGTAYSPRANNRSTGIIASRFSLRLILSFAPNLSSSRSLFISSPCILFFCARVSITAFFRVFRKLAYLRMTIRLFENRKIRKSQEKLNGLVSANYEGELLSTRQRVYRGRSPPTISLILTNMIQRARVFY